MSRNALFDVMVVLQNNEQVSLVDNEELSALEVEVTDNSYHKSSKLI